MEKNPENEPQKGALKEQTLLGVEAQRDNAIAKVNKKVIIGCVAGIVALLIGGGIWYWVHSSNVNKAADQFVEAMFFQPDSAKQMASLKALADDNTNAPNQAAALTYAGRLYQAGKYDEAAKYLEKADPSSDVVNVARLCLLGDCQVNLDKKEEAMKSYEKALDEADNNPVLSPYVLFKQASLYRAQNKFDKEFECIDNIRTNYPNFLNPEIEKYYERAKAAAGK